ncbi:hypothetical protein [Amycolatopsis sp. H20-H5]|uniref:hypothetical protein n=1 Tax=Amycolatopsis sp. H20-H5 TaxID=3046309 RepID=UPI002DB8210E|nr:hypothetical protein [Amycolatopsis sp. H20-H5]MEC3974309.1 hypothetical protein [Amycolatopsis sp. H20-H5]
MPAVAHQDGMVQGSYWEDPNDVLKFCKALTQLHIAALGVRASKQNNGPVVAVTSASRSGLFCSVDVQQPSE